MKHLILAALLTLPTLAAASLGPSITQSEAAASQTHLVAMAWSAPDAAPTPDCNTPTPTAVAPVLFACVAFPTGQ